jgi:hypothetical protein
MVACILYVFMGVIGISGLIPLTILCLITVVAIRALGKRFPLIKEYPPVNILTCPDCEFSIDKDKFAEDIFSCPDCGAPLEEEKTSK